MYAMFARRHFHFQNVNNFLYFLLLSIKNIFQNKKEFMVVSRKSNYGSKKRSPYRSYKKRKSNDDTDVLVSLLLLLLILGGIVWILGVIVQIIFTYYYILIILALIGFVVYFAYYNNKKSESSQFNSSPGNEGTTNREYNDPKISSPKMRFPSKERFPPGAYEVESFRRLENLKNYKLNSNEYQKSYFESNLQYENVEKGDQFEKYVVDRFDDRFFSIVEWTTDMSRKHNRFVESDCNPDLVIRDRKTNEIFCVECKYRSRLVNGYFDWSYPEQMNRYFSYAHERKIPFHIVLGFGGSPDSPSEVFCVPLEKSTNP
ncbi:MAG: hypothetical protein PHT13_12250, partial [Methanosarcina sp.]|nr:hypothetical protein [Methanosarcina sp.]